MESGQGAAGDRGKTRGKRIRKAVLSTLGSVFVSGVASGRLDASLNDGLFGSEQTDVFWRLPAWQMNLTVGLSLLAIAVLLTVWMTVPSINHVLSRSVARITRWNENEKTARAFKVIVLTLSPLNDSQRSFVQEAIAVLVARPDLRGLTGLRKFQQKRPSRPLASTWPDEPDNPGPIANTPWQQTLRLMLHHWQAKPVYYFVLSQTAAIDYRHFLELAKLLEINVERIAPDPHFFEGINSTNCINLTEYNDVEVKLDAACKAALAIANKATNRPLIKKFDESDLCIDITSGLKVFSAVATVRTINSEAKFSYVGTHGDPDEGNVVIYDASLQT